MIPRLRAFLLVEAVAFALAASVHAGITIQGDEAPSAATAESIIAIVLFAGLAISVARPAWTRPAALLAQGFSFLATCVGFYLAVIGVGTNTVADILYHAAALVVLAVGVVLAWRGESGAGVTA